MAAAKKVIDMARVRALTKTCSIGEIAKKVGCSRATLVKRCAEEGVPLPRMRGIEVKSEDDYLPVTPTAAVGTTPEAPQSTDPEVLVQQARAALPGLHQAHEKAIFECQRLANAVRAYSEFVSRYDAAQHPEEQQAAASESPVIDAEGY